MPIDTPKPVPAVTVPATSPRGTSGRGESAAAQAATSLVWGLGVLTCLLIVGIIVAIMLRRSALSFATSNARSKKPKVKLRSAWDVSADRMPLETTGPREDPESGTNEDPGADRTPRD